MVRVVRLVFASAWLILGLWTWGAEDGIQNDSDLAWLGFMVLLGLMGATVFWTRKGGARLIGAGGSVGCIIATVGQFSPWQTWLSVGWLGVSGCGLAILLLEVLSPKSSDRSSPS